MKFLGWTDPTIKFVRFRLIKNEKVPIEGLICGSEFGSYRQIKKW